MFPKPIGGKAFLFMKRLLNAIDEVNNRIKEYRQLLEVSYHLLKSDRVVVLKDDDECETAVDKYLSQLEAHGIPDNFNGGKNGQGLKEK